MGVCSPERAPIVFWCGIEDGSLGGTGDGAGFRDPFAEKLWGGEGPDTRMSCAVFHTEPGPQMQTVMANRTALPTRVLTSTIDHVDSELGWQKLACGFVCQSAIFPTKRIRPSVLSARGGRVSR